MSQDAPLLVTGASSGIGFATALILAASHRLILPVRSVERGDALQRAIKAIHSHADLQTTVCDLASLGSVREFSTQLAASLRNVVLGGIACIAGVQIVKGLQLSADGHELTFAVHHLAHSLLVLRLLGQLAPGAAVLFVGSSTHNAGYLWARAFGFEAGRFSSVEALARGDTLTEASEPARGRQRYANAKLCNLITMYGLAREIPATRLRFCAVDPGLVPGTGLARDNTALNRLSWATMRHVLPVFPGASTPKHSGSTIAWALTAPELEGQSGLHFNYRAVQSATSAAARDPLAGARLLAETRHFLQRSGWC